MRYASAVDGRRYAGVVERKRKDSVRRKHSKHVQVRLALAGSQAPATIDFWAGCCCVSCVICPVERGARPR
jgi:hypothetical protein